MRRKFLSGDEPLKACQTSRKFPSYPKQLKSQSTLLSQANGYTMHLIKFGSLQMRRNAVRGATVRGQQAAQHLGRDSLVSSMRKNVAQKCHSLCMTHVWLAVDN